MGEGVVPPLGGDHGLGALVTTGVTDGVVGGVVHGDLEGGEGDFLESVSKQDLTSAKDLTIKLSEGRESPYHRLN